MQALFTPAAQQSLQEIYNYIAEDNPGKAKEFIQHLKKQCFVLAENPQGKCGVFRGKIGILEYLD